MSSCREHYDNMTEMESDLMKKKYNGDPSKS